MIRGEEIDRFEVWLGAQPEAHYTGHLRVGDGLAPLPVGSQLDAATGWFTWAPGVGFVGSYDLVFVRWSGKRPVARHEVRVDPRTERPRARRRAGGDRHAALATGCRAAVRAGRVGGGSGRGDHHGHRHAARVGVSTGGRRAGVPGHADARRRAPGCRGDSWGPVPRHGVHARGAGADAWHLPISRCSRGATSLAPSRHRKSCRLRCATCGAVHVAQHTNVVGRVTRTASRLRVIRAWSDDDEPGQVVAALCRHTTVSTIGPHFIYATGPSRAPSPGGLRTRNMDGLVESAVARRDTRVRSRSRRAFMGGVAQSLPTSGEVTAAITITFAGAAQASIPVAVTLRLFSEGATAAPFGAVDTPLDSSTVTGAIPITGWALDDIEVTNVSICRAPLLSEGRLHACGGRTLVTLGNGVFIDGARPDVQAAFGAVPRSSRGGWGFMLLTNMLPNQGNGTFTL